MPAKNTETLDSHTAGGYKATLSNPKSSEEAKKHAQEMLDKAGIDANERLDSKNAANQRSNNDATDSQVAGGYKATLSNPNASDEAKKHAQEMLDKAGVDADDRAGGPSNNDASDNHVAGGFKATLNNPKASDEAKKHAQEMLDKAGVDAEERTGGPSNNDASDTHVAGGYKATLNNPKASEEAKKHAREMLEKAGVDPEERLSSSSGRRDDLTEEEKHRHHIEGGYKATLSNPKSSEEAKKHAQEMLDKLSKGEELPESERSKNNYAGKADSGDAHSNHVIGGYKATLSNPNSSEEARKHAQEMLDKLDGESSDKSADRSGEKHGLKRSSDDVESEDKESSGKGKQGFASMPKEKVQEIASKGGRTKNAGDEPSPKKSKSEESSSTDKKDSNDKESSGKGKQGFASMPKEKVQEIASKGGRTKNAGEEPASVKNQ